jgi:hypothetical protein
MVYFDNYYNPSSTSASTLIVFQKNPYTGVHPMDTEAVNK